MFRDELLLELLSQPTAPFREWHVLSKITRVLEDAAVPFFTDPIGNIVIGAASKADYLKLLKQPSPEPLRVFIAHTDHPGFHGVKWKTKNQLEIKWHGGSPTQHLVGSQAWLATREGKFSSGKFTQVSMHPSGRAIQSGIVQVAQTSSVPASEIFGGFQFRAPVWKDGELLYTHAADDLVGVFAILSLALDLKTAGKKKPFIGLLTRAEEVGFIGAIGHFELGWLSRAKRKVLCVSLETSRTLPGAEIGKGPVVRLGDRSTVFDAGALRILSDLALKTLPEQHQRRIMDGGSCEATAATVYGLPCIGMSVPLGNYHNQSLEGGPDSAPPNGPAPEFVHLQDVKGLIELCHSVLTPKLPWNAPWKTRRVEFKKSLREYQKLL